MVVQVLDRYYLGITALITLALQATAFAVCFTLQSDILTDASGALNFFLLALLTLAFGISSPPPQLPSYTPARNIIVSLAMMVWSLRLGGFLFFRVFKSGGKDHRFEGMRSDPLKFGGFYTFQFLWCWIVSLPITILNSPGVSTEPRPGSVYFPNPQPPFGNNATDVIGLIFVVVGILLEGVADVQKFRFKASKPPKDAMCDVGVWGWSRHPNYFGDILWTWGLWMICIRPAISETVTSSPRAALYSSVLSPLFLTSLLLFLSGLPTSEKPAQKKAFLTSSLHPDDPEVRDKWAKYKRYVQTTSILVPIPPRIYSRFPKLARWAVWDLPMYSFDEQKEGKRALAEERENQT